LDPAENTMKSFWKPGQSRGRARGGAKRGLRRSGKYHQDGQKPPDTCGPPSWWWAGRGIPPSRNTRKAKKKPD